VQRRDAQRRRERAARTLHAREQVERQSLPVVRVHDAGIEPVQQQRPALGLPVVRVECRQLLERIERGQPVHRQSVPFVESRLVVTGRARDRHRRAAPHLLARHALDVGLDAAVGLGRKGVEAVQDRGHRAPP